MSYTIAPLLGGTFDPVHNGHLRCALEISEWLKSPVRLVPSGQPAHRDAPGGSASDRLAMLRAATATYATLVVDDREVRRAGDTYSVDTLEALTAEEPGTAFAFIVGADAFAGLTRWRRWERLTELTHFILVDRPGQAAPLPEVLERWAAPRRTRDPARLADARSGLILEAEITPLELSATMLRGLLRAGRDPAFLVPDRVRDYLLAHRVYR
ncbi:MAG: nicotinate-nucleotide adenylyltransferase [Pseudomonadota bacterium]